MNTRFYTTPRVFSVKGHKVEDQGKIHLNSNEMLSFITESEKELDVVAKEWGFYATPSINSRLKKENFKTALVVNEQNQLYVMVVEKEKLAEFHTYLQHNQDQKVLSWLDEWMPQIDKNQ